MCGEGGLGLDDDDGERDPDQERLHGNEPGDRAGAAALSSRRFLRARAARACPVAGMEAHWLVVGGCRVGGVGAGCGVARNSGGVFGGAEISGPRRRAFDGRGGKGDLLDRQRRGDDLDKDRRRGVRGLNSVGVGGGPGAMG